MKKSANENQEELKQKKAEKTEKAGKKKSSPAFRALNKILFKVCFILFCLCALGSGGYYAFNKISQVRIERKFALANSSLQRCAELVTLKVSYSDIITVKKTRIAGLAKSFSIVRFSGILRAGISDISLSDIKISNGGKKIEVVLPEVEVLGNDISDIEVFDEARSIFVSVTLKEIVDEINAGRKASEEKLVEGGLLEDAQKQAVNAVKNMLLTAGFSDVYVN